MGLVSVIVIGLACCAVLAAVVVAAVLILAFIRARDERDRN